jgi:hypothetical protein
MSPVRSERRCGLEPDATWKARDHASSRGHAAPLLPAATVWLASSPLRLAHSLPDVQVSMRAEPLELSPPSLLSVGARGLYLAGVSQKMLQRIGVFSFAVGIFTLVGSYSAALVPTHMVSLLGSPTQFTTSQAKEARPTWRASHEACSTPVKPCSDGIAPLQD